MELSGRPLLATRVDDALYVERGPEPRILAAVARGLNVLILGEPGSGKTSLLHHLEHQLQRADEPVVYLDGRRSEDLDALLDELRGRVGVARPDPSVASPAQETLDALQGMPETRRWVALVDCPERDVAHTLFGRLRDVVWQLPVTWVVAADGSAADAFRRPPADAFFDLVERLDGLDETQASELLIRRGVSRSEAEELSSSAATSPRGVLDRARRSLLEHVAPDDIHRAELDFHRRLGQVSRAAALLAAELRGRGAVSASDGDLQRRMGWTRSRLTQVLKELEANGLATTTEAADGRAGRPRRMYEIVAS
jgi:energy-coupling factor transporter ATP-binding protein EcfA2